MSIYSCEIIEKNCCNPKLEYMLKFYNKISDGEQSLSVRIGAIPVKNLRYSNISSNVLFEVEEGVEIPEITECHTLEIIK